jgi:hypothetical protein
LTQFGFKEDITVVPLIVTYIKEEIEYYRGVLITSFCDLENNIISISRKK